MMANKMEVTKLVIDDREVNIYVENPQFLWKKQVHPQGRMLVDSEHLSFIYILDVDGDFLYISFSKENWSDLNQCLIKDLPVFLQIDEETRLSLLQFHEELLYFISNIKENNNYGAKMVQAVSDIFTV